MKNKLRIIQSKGVEWKYVIGKGEIRIYKPGTKQILKRIKFNPGEDYSPRSIEPGLVKTYIEEILPEEQEC